MKILLVQPSKPAAALGGEEFSMFEPLSLEYLAAGVAEHHDVRILDMRLDAALETHLNEFGPDIVGFTSYTVHVNTVRRLCEQVKDADPGIVTAVGGHHASVLPEDFSVPHVDVVVQGEGVIPFKHMVACLEQGKPFSDIRGATVDHNGVTIMRAGDFGPVDLDAFPFPSRKLTSPYRKRYFSEWMKPLASIRTSKGCRFKCTFCALWKMTDGQYLTRHPECIVRELAEIEEPYVFFADDESLLDADRMERLARHIKESGIRKRYFLYGRSDTIVRRPDLLEAWKEVGLERVFVGLESASDEHLNAIRKGSTVTKNTRAVAILKELGIDIFPTFIVRPDFSRDDFKRLRDYCLKLDLEFVGFSVLTPLPGTDLYDEVKNRLITRDYDHFDFFHTLLPTTLRLREFYREYKALYQGSRSKRNQLNLMRKYPLRELPSLFRLYGQFMKRLDSLAGDYENRIEAGA